MKKLGVLGGMGPAAGAEFLVRLINQTPAKKDQEHIPAVLWSDPTVPDRSTSLLNGDDLPWPKLREGILGLRTAGCDHIVIPCNTAHFWYDRLQELGVPITHIVDSVADQLRASGVVNTTIGIMGTKATISQGLYQNRLSAQGWNCITPTSSEMNELVQPAIDLIKSGKMLLAEGMLNQVMGTLNDQGANAIVLGCTELPLAIRRTSFKNRPIVNSIDSLVKAVLNIQCV